MAYGLIFDVDGVLADTETLIAEASIEMFKELYGHDFQVEDFRPFIGTGAIRHTLGPAEAVGLQIDLDKALPLRLANFQRKLGESDDISFRGARELIRAAADSPDWKLGLATSSPKAKSVDTLKAARIDPSVFQAWITGDMVKRPKPSAEIYVTAALVMRMPPIRCVAIEDAPLGIKAAKDGCLKCIAVTHTFPAEELEQADIIVNSLEEITLERLADLMESKKGERTTWGARLKA